MCKECHVVSVAIEINDLEALVRACHRRGWDFAFDQKTYRWVGRWYDDSPVPRQLFSTQEEYEKVCQLNRQERTEVMQSLLGHCTHAIRIPGAEGEIGLIEREGKLIPIWDYYAPGLKDIQPTNGMNGLLQLYAAEKAKLEAYRQGHSWHETRLEDGTLQVRVQL